MWKVDLICTIPETFLCLQIQQTGFDCFDPGCPNCMGVSSMPIKTLNIWSRCFIWVEEQDWRKCMSVKIKIQLREHFSKYTVIWPLRRWVKCDWGCLALCPRLATFFYFCTVLGHYYRLAMTPFHLRINTWKMWLTCKDHAHNPLNLVNDRFRYSGQVIWCLKGPFTVV